MNLRKLKRSSRDPIHNIVDLVQKPRPQTGPAVLIPSSRLFDINLRLIPNDEIVHQRLDRRANLDRISSRTSSHRLTTLGLSSRSSRRSCSTCLCPSLTGP